MSELRSRKLFEIKNIFLFLTLYFVIIPFYFEINSKSLIAIIIALLGCLFFFAGASTRKYFRGIFHPCFPSKLSIITGFSIVLIDFGVGLYKIIFGLSADDYTASFFIIDHDVLYFKIIETLVFSVKYYYLALFASRSRVYFYVAFFAALIYSISSPIRLVALQPIVIFTIFGYYFGYLRMGRLKIISALMIAPFVFVLLLLGRGLSGASFFERLIGGFNQLDIDYLIIQLAIALESFSSFGYFANIVDSNFVSVESGILRFFFMPISRSIWPDKPESISRIISKEYNVDQYFDGGGSVALIFGDAFINGHILGIILILAILGFCSKVVYNTMIESLDSRDVVSAVLVMSYAVFVYDFLYFYRGFFSELFWKALIFQFSFLFFLKIKLGIKSCK
jgi:hypothetical protein